MNDVHKGINSSLAISLNRKVFNKQKRKNIKGESYGKEEDYNHYHQHRYLDSHFGDRGVISFRGLTGIFLRRRE